MSETAQEAGKRYIMSCITYIHSTAQNEMDYRSLPADLTSVLLRYPVRVSDYYGGLIQQPGDAIWKQCMPDIRELEDDAQLSDPLDETLLSPVPGVIHRYPDRVVVLVSNCCPVYCRFCMRKRLVGTGSLPISDDEFSSALDYIAADSRIRDVLLSGGDPLMLADESLHYILSRLRAISHVGIIRIGSRVPVTLPERVTPELCQVLKKFHPLYLNTHFNHPAELTDASARACSLLADAGIPLGNQTVLLRDVNDNIDTMRHLMTGLLGIRVRPYYLHHLDLVRGTAHFRTSVATGLDIIRALRGHVSGLAVPHYVIDLPGGKGKVALLPDDVERQGELLLLKTYTGEQVSYRDTSGVLF